MNWESVQKLHSIYKKEVGITNICNNRLITPKGAEVWKKKKAFTEISTNILTLINVTIT